MSLPQALHSSIGEGSKRSLLLLSSLLPWLLHRGRGQGWRQQLVAELARARALWQQEVGAGQGGGQEGGLEALREDVRATISSSLGSRLPPVVASQLTSLLWQHICESTDLCESPDVCESSAVYESSSVCESTVPASRPSLLGQVSQLSRSLSDSTVLLYGSSLEDSYTGGDTSGTPHVTAAGEGVLLQAELTGPTGSLSCSRREGAVVKMVVLAEEEQEEATLLLQEGGLGRVSVAAWERAGREVGTGLC